MVAARGCGRLRAALADEHDSHIVRAARFISGRCQLLTGFLKAHSTFAENFFHDIFRHYAVQTVT